MKLSRKDWNKYVTRLSAINKTAGRRMQAWIDTNGTDDIEALVAYAHALTTAYGEAASATACEMYDEISTVQKAHVPPAVPKQPQNIKYVEKAVRSTLDRAPSTVPDTVSEMVKRTGAETTLKNAKRDGAYFAWVPNGDSCAFCITLASNGWRRASKKTVEGDHKDHIHANCDCEFAISFNGPGNIEGYDPEKYREMYDNAEGDTWKDKLNSMSRDYYVANRESIRRQHRIANAKRVDLLELYRKKKNTGPFEDYSELMSLKHVKGVAADMDIDPKGVRYRIDRNEELKGTGLFGHTSNDGRTVTLYPDAFMNREQLVKTIGHENIHLNQIKKDGIVKTTDELSKREQEARNSEERWWQSYVKKTGYRQ